MLKGLCISHGSWIAIEDTEECPYCEFGRTGRNNILVLGESTKIEISPQTEMFTQPRAIETLGLESVAPEVASVVTEVEVRTIVAAPEAETGATDPSDNA